MRERARRCWQLAYGTDGTEDCIIRRGLRADKYVATYKFKWTTSNSPGFVVRWLSPGDYLAIAVSGTDRKARKHPAKRRSESGPGWRVRGVTVESVRDQAGELIVGSSSARRLTGWAAMRAFSA
jgi:hypothetical protein